MTSSTTRSRAKTAVLHEYAPLAAPEAAFVCALSVAHFHSLYRTSGAAAAAPDSNGDDEKRAYGYREVVLVRCWWEIGMQISVARRETFMRNLESPANGIISCGGGLFADVKPLMADISRRYDLIGEARRLIQPMKMGQLKGYRFVGLPHSVYAVHYASMAGLEVTELQEKFPGLTQKHLELTSVWAAIEPPRGRRRLIV